MIRKYVYYGLEKLSGEDTFLVRIFTRISARKEWVYEKPDKREKVDSSDKALYRRVKEAKDGEIIIIKIKRRDD